MKRCVISGSFDPITDGHLYLIEKASELFEEVSVCISLNSNKKYMFSLLDRKEMVIDSCLRFPNVKVCVIFGLIADYCKEQNIKYIVRGVRNSSDYVYETNLSQVNRDIGNLITILIPSPPSMAHVSSSLVRELINHNSLKALDYIPYGADKFVQKMYHGRTKRDNNEN